MAKKKKIKVKRLGTKKGFAECVRLAKARGKRNPAAYCAEIGRQVLKKKFGKRKKRK